MKITKEYEIETVSVEKYKSPFFNFFETSSWNPEYTFIVTGKDSTGKEVYTQSFRRLRDAIKRANEIMLEEFI